ncbi:MAG TPA: NUDIX hydrolase [bacterium]|nr:NUDIX hydrolase [bacterium]HPN34412.1 NUDIX hydrolase [bacterium]
MTEYPGIAVRALIRDSQGRILLLRRQNTHYYDGQWCLPGGKVEYGQTLEEAVVREVLEETALTCLDSDYLFFNESLPGRENDLHYITFYFCCRTAGEVAVNQESEEYAWVRPEELTGYTIPPGHYEAILKALSPG